MSVATVRTLIADAEVYSRHTTVGDYETVDFALPHAPIVAGSQKVYVAGALKTEGADYTCSDATGVITFAALPGVDLAITINYRHTILSDAEIQTILTLEGDDDFMAAAQCLEMIATNQVLVLKVVKTLDISTDGAAVSKALLERAERLRARSAAADMDSDGGFDIAEMVINDFQYRERVRDEAIREQ